MWARGPWFTAVSAASTRARSRASGTTMTTPAPAAAVVAAAMAISAGHSGPGRADQAARTGRPSASAVRNAGPAEYRLHEPGPGRAFAGAWGAAGARGAAGAWGPGEDWGAAEAWGASRSAVAWRGGMASLSTSASVPAYRSATTRARSKISGVSTGSGEITRSRRASRPWCSLVGARSSR